MLSTGHGVKNNIPVWFILIDVSHPESSLSADLHFESDHSASVVCLLARLSDHEISYMCINLLNFMCIFYMYCCLSPLEISG